jgi:hypothetical protein
MGCACDCRAAARRHRGIGSFSVEILEVNSEPGEGCPGVLAESDGTEGLDLSSEMVEMQRAIAPLPSIPAYILLSSPDRR